MQLLAFFPRACAVVAFVLSILCLFAGYKPDFMENYHIITLNTSTLGQSITSGSTTGSPSLGSIFARISYDPRSSIGGDIGGVLDNTIGDITSGLGIKQWYSMHIMNMCEGTYAPSATASGARLNVSSCTVPKAMYHFDISEQLSKELQVGNLHLSLSDIGWPSDIQDGLNGLNTVLSTLFILYIVGISAAGLNIITPPIVLLQKRSRLGQFSKGLASLSFLSLLAAAIIITFVQFKAVDLINKYGNDIGVYASGGGEFMAFTWVAVLFIFIVVVADTCGERMATWDIPRVWSAGPSQIDFKTAKLRY